jgi:hypothetical protein
MMYFSNNIRLLFLVLSFGLSISNGPVLAQGSNEKAELARRVMDLHKQEGFLEKAVQGALRNAPAEQQEARKRVVSKIDQDAVYAGWAKKVEELYTIAEMRAYLNYASTDIGRSILRKNAEIAAAMQEVLYREVMKAMSEE